MFGLKRSASADFEKKKEKAQKLEPELLDIRSTGLVLEMTHVFSQAPWILEKTHKYVMDLWQPEGPNPTSKTGASSKDDVYNAAMPVTPHVPSTAPPTPAAATAATAPPTPIILAHPGAPVVSPDSRGRALEEKISNYAFNLGAMPANKLQWLLSELEPCLSIFRLKAMFPKGMRYDKGVLLQILTFACGVKSTESTRPFQSCGDLLRALMNLNELRGHRAANLVVGSGGVNWQSCGCYMPLSLLNSQPRSSQGTRWVSKRTTMNTLPTWLWNQEAHARGTSKCACYFLCLQAGWQRRGSSHT
eukprot:2609761-Amphidinium_carterae.3